MATNLTDEAKAGQAAGRAGSAEVPYIYSSPAWMGFTAGRRLSHYTDVVSAKMSRGFSVKLETTGGNSFLVVFDKDDLNKRTVQRA